MIFEAQVQLAARLKINHKIDYLEDLLNLKIQRNKLKERWYLEKRNREKKIIQIKLNEIDLDMIKLEEIYKKNKERNKIRTRQALIGAKEDEYEQYKMALKLLNKRVNQIEKKIQKQDLLYKKIIRKFNPL